MATIPTTVGRVHRWMQLADGTRNYGIDWEDESGTSAERILVRDQPDDGFARFLAAAPVRVAELEAELKALRAEHPKEKIRLFGPACVREDQRDLTKLWLLNGHEKGWGAYGHQLSGWDELFRRFDVIVGAPQTDRCGIWWPATPRTLAGTTVAS